MVFREHDSVELTRLVDDPYDGQFPAGTTGAIVDLRNPYALVEIVRENGTTAGLIEVPLADLRVLVPARAAW